MSSLIRIFAFLYLCFTPAFLVNLSETIKEPDLPLAALEQILGRRSTTSPNQNFFTNLQGTNSTEEALNNLVQYGLDKSRHLFDVKEPEIYRSGNFLSKDDPGALLAAFSYQMREAKQLSVYGYATLGASSLVAKRLKLTRNDLSALARVSLRQTRLFEECPLKSDNVVCPPYSRLYRTIDGTCNNLAHPTWGAAMRPFLRFLPPEYRDGIEAVRESVDKQPLPSPRLISSLIHRNVPSPPSQFTTMLMQWGQFLDHDLTLIAATRGFNGSIPRCCTTDGSAKIPYGLTHPDCLPIEVPQNDPFYSQYGVRCLEFVRSTPAPHDDCSLGPRDQINQITSFLDASNVYGSSESEASALRLYKLGKLKYKDLLFRKALLPSLDHHLEGECRPTSRNMYCFRGGDARTNEQPGLASMHTLWMREHNRIAVRLFEINPHWSDERLYHEARRIVAAEMQQITFNEWLPLILGDKVMEVFGLKLVRSGYYYGYNNTINPTSANSFGTAAFRFGHSLVPSNLIRCDKWHSQLKINISLRRELMDPGAVHNMGAVDRLMLGLTSQQAMKRDEFIVDELTNHLFQTPKKPFGMDLISINIQRGRDHGLPPYVVWRENCGLTPIVNWGQLLSIMDDDTVGRLRIAYKNVEDIDLFPGGMAEKPVIGGIVGPTFACILGQQFLNLRQGDRFWYELGDQPSSFTETQLRELRKVTLSRVLCDNLDDIETVQPWLFLIPDNEVNPRISCRSANIPVANLDAWKESVRARPVNLHAHAAVLQDLTLSENSIENGEFVNIPKPEDNPWEMPLPKREDDPVDEIPQPIKIKDSGIEKRSVSSGKMRSKMGEVEGVYEKFDLFRAHAFNNKLFYGKK